jgi:hypothetical protein
MSDPGHSFQSDGLDANSEEIARIVIKDRPEVATCLDGLVFRGQEDALFQLLRAALVNMTSSVQLDLEDEGAISACIPDMKAQAERMPLAAMALDWEIQTRRDPQSEIRQRSAGYRAGVDELLHGPLAPLGLENRHEQAVVVRWVQSPWRGKPKLRMPRRRREKRSCGQSLRTLTASRGISPVSSRAYVDPPWPNG